MLKKYLLGLTVAIFAGFIFFALTYKKPLELYPENQTFFEFDVVSNIAKDRGFSEITVDSASGHLHFRYNYEKDSDDPFAILMFHAHELARHLNLADYRYIDIDLDQKKSQDFTISLYMYIPGFSDPVAAETHRPYSLKVRVKENQTHYHYKLQDFATPAWWFSHFKVDDFTLPKTDWSQFTHLTISNFEYLPSDTELQVVFKRFRFIDDLGEKARNAAIFGFFIFLITLWFFNVRKKRKEEDNETKKSNNRTNIAKYNQEDTEKLFEYIEKNLSNPLLSLDLIAKEIGLNSFIVNEILKDKKDTQYKHYIDKLRIDEAKRLLAETEHQISVIAERCGYCYSNSFSRIFGKYCGMTPNEYRKKFSGK
jgi:AraC-like DNA-binding protein